VSKNHSSITPDSIYPSFLNQRQISAGERQRFNIESFPYPRAESSGRGGGGPAVGVIGHVLSRLQGTTFFKKSSDTGCAERVVGIDG
jgi:hypothetical protein